MGTCIASATITSPQVRDSLDIESFVKMTIKGAIQCDHTLCQRLWIIEANFRRFSSPPSVSTVPEVDSMRLPVVPVVVVTEPPGDEAAVNPVSPKFLFQVGFLLFRKTEI